MRQHLKAFLLCLPLTALLGAPMDNAKENEQIKRNCGINFSNDCGSMETAYMNGLKNFFGSKRRLNVPSAERRQFLTENSKRLAEPNDDEKSLNDDDIDELVIKYIANIRERLMENWKRKEQDCLELTGLPC
ncbi:uncharacterized protein [Watersipora subatra]|uniref:uncharacterized protein isoform X2 n=1 Tax=Watersipora subatra TaxID=2589382 RepID=UPI00355B415D